MVANFKLGPPEVSAVDREEATFSFRQKDIYDWK